MTALRTCSLPVLALSALLTIPSVASPATNPTSFGPTLTAPAASPQVTAGDGFIKRWWLLEPIPANGLTPTAVRSIVQKEYFPNQLTMIPKDGDTEAVDGATLAWHAVDTKLYNVNLYHFAYALKKPTSNVLFWTVTVVNSPREMKDVRLAIGSNSASVWWLNDQEVAAIYGDRQTVIDDGVSKRTTLKKGPNVIRAAVINGGGATDFCARFLGPDDKPIAGLTITLK